MSDGKIMAALAALALTISASGKAWAEGANNSLPRNDRLGMFRAAGINKEQEAQLMSLTKEYENALLPKTRDLITAMREMHSLSLQPDPDPKVVLAKQDDINKINGELSLDRVKFAMKMRAILTPEQKQKYVELMKANARKLSAGTDSPVPAGSQPPANPEQGK